MKISLTGSLLGIAALALAGLGVAVVVLDSELTAQNAVVDKHVIQLANKKLEVNGLVSDIQTLSNQVADLGNGGQALRLAPRFSEANLKFQIAKLRSTIDAKFGGYTHISSYETS